MELIYHLPSISYNHTRSFFSDFVYKEALGYLKIIYKNPHNFQRHFLRKLEHIPNLQKLCYELGRDFEKANPLSLREIEGILNKNCRELALNHYKGLYDTFFEEKKPKQSYFDRYVEKIKEYLDNVDNEPILMPFYNTEIVENKEPYLINKIERFVIPEHKEFVHFSVKNVETIVLNKTIKHFLSPDCDIKEIILHDNLIYLDACSNKISNIKLSENLIELDIASNELTELKCNNKLKNLCVTNNKLKSLELNEKLEELTANANEIESIVLNSNLKEAYLCDNPLMYVKLNKNLKELSISHPENKNIEIDNSVENNQVVIDYYIN